MQLTRRRLFSLLTVSFALVAADSPTWQGKPVAEWNEEDSRQILNDSPWVRTVQATMTRGSANGPRQRGMGRGGGIGIGGIGIGLPGMGGTGGRRGGGGDPGGGYPPGGSGPGGPDPGQQAPMLQLRWASAMPVRVAELKAHDAKANTVDEDHYAIVVYGVPERMIEGKPDDLARQLKKEASIKREGKRDLKPSDVEVSRRESGTAIVYLFPRTNEITRKDGVIEFQAKILRLEVSQPFAVSEMVYQGKLEL